MRVILICGSREWTDADAIVRELVAHGANPETDTIIQGEARGADLLGKAAAISLGFTLHRNLFGYKARWDKYGKAAGMFRNTDMQQALIVAKREGKDTLVLAFTPDLSKSRGTRHMCTISEQAGIPVEVFNA